MTAAIFVGATLALGAGIYFGALSAHEAKPEDHFPKLVLRSEGEPEPAAEGEEKDGGRRRDAPGQGSVFHRFLLS